MYAITKHSRRARGQAVACDLVRVVCRGVAESGLRKRLAEDFGGYLVTEPPLLPVWKIDSRVVVLGVSPGWRHVSGLSDCLDEVFSMDAPEFIPAGSIRKYAPLLAENVCAEARRVVRP